MVHIALLFILTMKCRVFCLFVYLFVCIIFDLYWWICFKNHHFILWMLTVFALVMLAVICLNIAITIPCWRVFFQSDINVHGSYTIMTYKLFELPHKWQKPTNKHPNKKHCFPLWLETKSVWCFWRFWKFWKYVFCVYITQRGHETGGIVESFISL